MEEGLVRNEGPSPRAMANRIESTLDHGEGWREGRQAGIWKGIREMPLLAMQ